MAWSSHRLVGSAPLGRGKGLEQKPHTHPRARARKWGIPEMGGGLGMVLITSTPGIPKGGRGHNCLGW
jgi:hypothetical protein